MITDQIRVRQRRMRQGGIEHRNRNTHREDYKIYPERKKKKIPMTVS